MGQGSRGRRVEDVLRGRMSYDALSIEEQEDVREAWEESITKRRGELNYERKFRSEGRPYVELGDDGVIRRVEP